MRIEGNYPPPDIPYEDNHQTKEILRMEMNGLYQAIQDKKPVTYLHQLHKDTVPIVDKLNDPEIKEAFEQINSLIDHHYPISEQTPLDIIEKLGRCFKCIDERTMY